MAISVNLQGSLRICLDNLAAANRAGHEDAEITGIRLKGCALVTLFEAAQWQFRRTLQPIRFRIMRVSTDYMQRVGLT